MATMFSDVFDKIDVAIQEVIAGNVSSLMNVLEPLLLSAFTVYLLFLFLSYWNGRFEDSIVDFFKKVIAWILILGFSVNVSGYNQTIMPIVMGLGDGLSQALNGQTNATVLDNMANSMIEIVIQNQDEADTYPMPFGLGDYLKAVANNAIVIISFSVFLVVSASYILLAKIFTGILALVGPVFISLGLFPATRQYFTAWINQVVNYSLMLLLMNITASFMIKIYGEVLNLSSVEYPITVSFLVGMVLLSFMFFVVLLKIPELANGLAGGVSVGGFTQAGRAIGNGRDGVNAGVSAGKTEYARGKAGYTWAKGKIFGNRMEKS